MTFNPNEYLGADDIDSAIEKKGKLGDEAPSNFYRVPEGKSVVRLLPRMEHRVPWRIVYSHRNGVDNAIGTCLKTWQERYCPICKESWDLYNSEIEDEKAQGKKINAGIRYLFNAYIVNDEKNPDNIGQVKILSVGIKLWEFIAENYKELNMAIFNPDKGFNLEINKQIRKGEFPDYNLSKFARKETKIKTSWEDIKEKLYNLDEAVTHDTPEKLKEKFKFLFDASADSYQSTSKSTPASSENTSNEIPINEAAIDQELNDLLDE